MSKIYLIWSTEGLLNGIPLDFFLPTKLACSYLAEPRWAWGELTNFHMIIIISVLLLFWIQVLVPFWAGCKQHIADFTSALTIDSSYTSSSACSPQNSLYIPIPTCLPAKNLEHSYIIRCIFFNIETHTSSFVCPVQLAVKNTSFQLNLSYIISHTLNADTQHKFYVCLILQTLCSKNISSLRHTKPMEGNEETIHCPNFQSTALWLYKVCPAYIDTSPL